MSFTSLRMIRSRNDDDLPLQGETLPHRVKTVRKPPWGISTAGRTGKRTFAPNQAPNHLLGEQEIFGFALICSSRFAQPTGIRKCRPVRVSSLSWIQRFESAMLRKILEKSGGFVYDIFVWYWWRCKNAYKFFRNAIQVHGHRIHARHAGMAVRTNGKGGVSYGLVLTARQNRKRSSHRCGFRNRRSGHSSRHHVPPTIQGAKKAATSFSLSRNANAVGDVDQSGAKPLCKAFPLGKWRNWPKPLGIEGISRSQVSEMTKELNDQAEEFRNRPLASLPSAPGRRIV